MSLFNCHRKIDDSSQRDHFMEGEEDRIVEFSQPIQLKTKNEDKQKLLTVLKDR